MTEMCRLYSRLGTRMLVGTGDVFETLNFIKPVVLQEAM